MPVETILEPINGLEAKKILKSMMEERIDKIKYLSVGNAFKQVRLGFELIFEAFPADCPVPLAEWQILMGIDNGEDVEFDKDKTKLEMLREKHATLLENAERIEKFLKKYAPLEVIEVVESDSGVPDELRVKHNIPVPMLHTSPSGKKTEIAVDAKDLK